MYGNTAWRGLVPPTAGCEWQLEQELLLNRGPRPLLAAPWTTWFSWNWPDPLLEKSSKPAVDATEARGWPASTVPPRTPGSCARLAAGIWATMTLANHRIIRNVIHEVAWLQRATFNF